MNRIRSVVVGGVLGGVVGDDLLHDPRDLAAAAAMPQSEQLHRILVVRGLVVLQLAQHLREGA